LKAHAENTNATNSKKARAGDSATQIIKTEIRFDKLSPKTSNIRARNMLNTMGGATFQ
jgi:hypothetical protein